MRQLIFAQKSVLDILFCFPDFENQGNRTKDWTSKMGIIFLKVACMSKFEQSKMSTRTFY